MKDTGPLSGWLIVCAGGRTLVGKPANVLRDLPICLQPVYDATLGMQPSPTGVARITFVAPLFGFNIPHAEIPTGSLIVPVELLSLDERRALATAIDNAEKIAQAMRAKESGIVIAGTH